MFVEFVWSILGLGYLTGRGIKEQARSAVNRQNSLTYAKHREEFMAQWTDVDLEAQLRDEIMSPKFSKIVERVEKYKEERGELSIFDAELWKTVGIVGFSNRDSKKRIVCNERLLKLAMHTYGKRTVEDAKREFGVQNPMAYTHGNRELIQANITYRDEYLRRQMASYKRQDALRNLEFPFDTKLQWKLWWEVSNARTLDPALKSSERYAERLKNYNTIWERIESYKNDGCCIPEDQREIWELVCKERLPLPHSGELEDEYSHAILQLLMTTYGKQLLKDALLKVYRYSEIPESIKPYIKYDKPW